MARIAGPALGRHITASPGARFAGGRLDALRLSSEPRGDSVIVTVSGDGAFYYAIGALATHAQIGTNSVHVVLNNGTLGFVELEMKANGFLDFGCDLKNPNFAAMANAMGIKSVAVYAEGDAEAPFVVGLGAPDADEALRRSFIRSIPSNGSSARTNTPAPMPARSLETFRQ